MEKVILGAALGWFIGTAAMYLHHHADRHYWLWRPVSFIGLLALVAFWVFVP
jgi:hypothetical protein